MGEASTCSCPAGLRCALRLCSRASAVATHAQMLLCLPAASTRKALSFHGSCGMVYADAQVRHSCLILDSIYGLSVVASHSILSDNALHFTQPGIYNVRIASREDWLG